MREYEDFVAIYVPVLEKPFENLPLPEINIDLLEVFDELTFPQKSGLDIFGRESRFSYSSFQRLGTIV